MPKLVAVDLFCGAGGLSLGLEQGGLDVRLGIDFDKNALETYRHNFSHPALLADVKDICARDIYAAAGTDSIDLLAGGPSCQGFSTHGKRNADDQRNFLYKEYLRLVSEIRPRVVLMENVKGLLITRNGEFKKALFRAFSRLGYHVTLLSVNAAHYGVPQLRERVFFVASLEDSPIAMPPKTHFLPKEIERQASLLEDLWPAVTVGDAIGDLPISSLDQTSKVRYGTRARSAYQRLMRLGGDGFVYNHSSKPVSELALSIIQRIPQGCGLRSLSDEELPARFKSMRRVSSGNLRRDCTTLYHRLALDKPAYTITCYFTNVSAGAFTHPLENRAITPREAARLQSFPDRFQFVGAQIPKQIGNAVPPLLGSTVAESIIRHVRATRRRRVA